MFGFLNRAPDPTEVDLSSKRSISIRSNDDKHVLVDFFYHEGQYWTANIPLRVVDVFGQSFNFSNVRTRRGKNGPEIVHDQYGQPVPRFSFINHLQTRFKTDSGASVDLYPLHTDIELINQTSNQPTHQLNDFVYSVEATGPPGISFGFKNGLAGTLLCMHRFLSTQEMVFERVVVQGQFVWESPSLRLENKEKQTVLLKSLERSDRAGLDEVYYLYRCCATNNCTSNPFQIVDECVKYTFLQKLGALAYRLPLNPRLYLRIRGLDSDPTFRRLVRTDFESYIKASETQQRKRDTVRAMIRQRRQQIADQG